MKRSADGENDEGDNRSNTLNMGNKTAGRSKVFEVIQNHYHTTTYLPKRLWVDRV